MRRSGHAHDATECRRRSVHHTISTDAVRQNRTIATAVLNPWRLRLLGLLDSLGTVRAVAETLHLSPSTVSQQLAVLETETRSRLLERSGRRVRLTRPGSCWPAGAARSWTGWPRRRRSCGR